jgi:uncharacterized protein YegL
MENQGIQVIPFYFLADVSYSMDGEPIKALNNLLPAVKEAMQQNPAVSDMIRFCLMSFSDDVKVELPLSDLTDVPTSSLPNLELRGGTSFSSALTKLRTEIIKDFSQLKADGFLVKRPVALFLSDGGPTEEESEWKNAFEALTNISVFPNLVPIGIGDCDRDVLRSLRHRKDGPAPAPALFLDDNTNIGGMINEMISNLTKSIIASASSLANGTGSDGGHANTVFQGMKATPGWDVELD